MQPILNYDKQNLRFILLGKVLKFIENKKDYFSYENYKIIPAIFPKEIFRINKFKAQIPHYLMIYKNKNETYENKKLTKHLQKLLLKKFENWKEYKPTRGNN